jgi:hypothetical protein
VEIPNLHTRERLQAEKCPGKVTTLPGRLGTKGLSAVEQGAKAAGLRRQVPHDKL